MAHRRLSSGGLPWHVQQDVRSLFAAFAEKGDDRPLRRPLKQGGVTRRAAEQGEGPRAEREGPRAELSSLLMRETSQSAESERKGEKRRAASVSCDSFEAILRLYYGSADPKQIEAMLALVTPEFGRLERTRWVRRMRENCTEQIRQAFLMGDDSGDGGLDMNEFIAAVELHSGDGPAGTPRIDALKAAFAAADRDGNGVLDFDEFLELVATHPMLVASFEQILVVGCERRRRLEEFRQTIIFRHAISPTTHATVSPSGRRRRPNLFDLRAAHEVRLPMPNFATSES